MHTMLTIFFLNADFACPIILFVVAVAKGVMQGASLIHANQGFKLACEVNGFVELLSALYRKQW